MRRSRRNIAISKMYFSICRLSTDYYVLVGRQRLLSHYRHFKRFQVNWAQKNVQTYSNGCSTSRRCDGLVSLASRTNHTLPPHHHELHDTFSTTCLMSKNPGKKKKKSINQKSVYSTTKIPFHHQLWVSQYVPRSHQLTRFPSTANSFLGHFHCLRCTGNSKSSDVAMIYAYHIIKRI